MLVGKSIIRVVLAAMLAAGPMAASAAPAGVPGLKLDSAVELAQGRPGGGRPPHRGGSHWGGRPPVHHHHHHRYYRRGPSGAAIGAGILGGIIAGAAISDASRQNAEASRQDAAARCAADFRSFNHATGTIRGYDGVVRACPYLR